MILPTPPSPSTPPSPQTPPTPPTQVFGELGLLARQVAALSQQVSRLAASAEGSSKAVQTHFPEAMLESYVVQNKAVQYHHAIL